MGSATSPRTPAVVLIDDFVEFADARKRSAWDARDGEDEAVTKAFHDGRATAFGDMVTVLLVRKASLPAALLTASPAAPRSQPERHGYGCPLDGDDMAPDENCTHCCRHGWVEPVQGKPCPQCSPAAPEGETPRDVDQSVLDRLRAKLAEAREALAWRSDRVVLDLAPPVYQGHGSAEKWAAEDATSLGTAALDVECYEAAIAALAPPPAPPAPELVELVLNALESDATAGQRKAAWNALRDWASPLPSGPPAPVAMPEE